MATENEASVLDHGKVKQYNIHNGLPSNVVFDLRETHDGDIWIATARRTGGVQPRR